MTDNKLITISGGVMMLSAVIIVLLLWMLQQKDINMEIYTPSDIVYVEGLCLHFESGRESACYDDRDSLKEAISDITAEASSPEVMEENTFKFQNQKGRRTAEVEYYLSLVQVTLTLDDVSVCILDEVYGDIYCRYLQEYEICDHKITYK